MKDFFQASQAYLTGLFGDHEVTPCVAKSESTSFLLCMAWLGLKKTLTVLSRDKDLAKKIQGQESFDFTRIQGHHEHHNDHHHEHDHDQEHDHDDNVHLFDHNNHQNNGHIHTSDEQLSEVAGDTRETQSELSVLDIVGDIVDPVPTDEHNLVHGHEEAHQHGTQD